MDISHALKLFGQRGAVARVGMKVLNALSKQLRARGAKRFFQCIIDVQDGAIAAMQGACRRRQGINQARRVFVGYDVAPAAAEPGRCCHRVSCSNSQCHSANAKCPTAGARRLTCTGTEP